MLPNTAKLARTAFTQVLKRLEYGRRYLEALIGQTYPYQMSQVCTWNLLGAGARQDAKIIATALKENYEQVHSTKACCAKAAYEGEGKTTVKVLNQDPDAGLLIDAYGTHGFRLNNGVTVLGPMAIFPKTVMSWQVRGAEEVTEESLRFFKLLVPKLDLIVVGLETNQRHVVDRVLLAARNKLKINVEILSIEHACSTFNFLNAEGRSVAGALIPPLAVQQTEDDMFQTKKDQGTLYQIGNLPD